MTVGLRENCTTLLLSLHLLKTRKLITTELNNLNDDSPRLANLLAWRTGTPDPWSCCWSFLADDREVARRLWIPSWFLNKDGLDLTLALVKSLWGLGALLLASKPGLELIDLVSLTGGVFVVELEPPVTTVTLLLLLFNCCWCCCSSPLLGVLAATDLLIFHT